MQKDLLLGAAVLGILGACGTSAPPVAPVVDVTPAASATTKAPPPGTAKPPMRESWSETQPAPEQSDDQLLDMMRGDTTARPRDKHCCKGKNPCKGMGGCKTAKSSCSGQNQCKGMGGCRGPGAAGCP